MAEHVPSYLVTGPELVWDNEYQCDDITLNYAATCAAHCIVVISLYTLYCCKNSLVQQILTRPSHSSSFSLLRIASPTLVTT